MITLKKQHRRYSNYKDSGVEWIGEIPSDWGLLKLKYCLSKNDGGVWGEDGSDYDTYVLRSTEIDLHGNWTDDEPVKRKLSKTEEISGRLFENDLVLTKSSGSEKHLGKTALVTKDIEAKKCAYSNFMQRLRTNGKLMPKLLFYLLNNEIGRNQINFWGLTTSGLVNLNRDIINQFTFSIPTKNEQLQIIAFLDEKIPLLDSIIEKKKQQIELLKEKRTALINKAVTRGLEDNAEIKDSGVEWIGEIPKGWEVRKLKTLGKAVIGLTYSPENVTDEENGILVLRSSNIQNRKLCFDNNVYVNKENIPKKLLTKEGDILVCSRNGSRHLIGKNACIDKQTTGVTFGAFMTIFRSKHWKFLSHVFNSFLFEAQSSSFLTSTINQLTTGNLNNMVVSIPMNTNEQEKIISYLNSEIKEIDRTIGLVKKSINLLQEYKTSLISKVVTGKVNIINNFNN